MKYIKRDVPSKKRNGQIVSFINNYHGSSGSSSSSGGSSVGPANCLPAYLENDGVYHVRLDTVVFDGLVTADMLKINKNADIAGSVTAGGEVTAYKAQEASVMKAPEETYNIDDDPIAKINLIKVELSKISSGSTLDDIKGVLINLSKML